MSAAELRDGVRRCWPGLLLASVVAFAAYFVSDNRGGPTLLYALLIGMALNSIATEGNARAGVDFAARSVLRFGVALLGARITLEQIGALGWRSGAIVVVSVIATIVFGMLAARAFKQSARFGILTGGATAICGASAAIAIATVLPRDDKSERELIFTVAGVTAMSTVAMIVYPAAATWLGLDPRQTGIFLGGTIHDVAQVVGAGYSVSPQAGDSAVLTKMLRVAMLLPVVMALSLVVRHRLGAAGVTSDGPLVPPFLLVFVGLAVLSSAGLVPLFAAGVMNDVARICLVVAIAAVGLKTSPLEMKKVGGRAIAMLATEALFLAALVIVAQKLSTPI